MQGRKPLVFLNDEAWKIYTLKDAGIPPARQFLRDDLMGALSVKLGRPLNLDELLLLSDIERHPDGSRVVEICHCGRKFTPRWWKDIADPKFLLMINKDFSIAAALKNHNHTVLTFGAYRFTPNEGRDYTCACGPAWWWDRPTNKHILNGASDLVAIKEKHPERFWGISGRELDKHLDALKTKRADARAVARLAEQLHAEQLQEEAEQQSRQIIEKAQLDPVLLRLQRPFNQDDGYQKPIRQARQRVGGGCRPTREFTRR